MKTKLIVKIRQHYCIYYLQDKANWMFVSKNKWGNNIPKGLSLPDTRNSILIAVEQIYGFKFTKKLNKKNSTKNSKNHIQYTSNFDSLLKV